MKTLLNQKLLKYQKKSKRKKEEISQEELKNLFIKGLTYFKQKNYHQAINTFKEVVKIKTTPLIQEEAWSYLEDSFKNKKW